MKNVSSSRLALYDNSTFRKSIEMFVDTGGYQVSSHHHHPFITITHSSTYSVKEGEKVIVMMLHEIKRHV